MGPLEPQDHAACSTLLEKPYFERYYVYFIVRGRLWRENARLARAEARSITSTIDNRKRRKAANRKYLIKPCYNAKIMISSITRHL